MGAALVKASPEGWVSSSMGAMLPRPHREHLLHHHQPLLPKHHLSQTLCLFLLSPGECRCLGRNRDIGARKTKAEEVHPESPPSPSC